MPPAGYWSGGAISRRKSEEKDDKDRRGEPEGRGRQDNDRDQPRHRARGDRLAHADYRPRPAGQCLDRARNQSRTARIFKLRPAARRGDAGRMRGSHRSEEHTSELQSLMRISYAVFCLKKKISKTTPTTITKTTCTI